MSTLTPTTPTNPQDSDPVPNSTSRRSVFAALRASLFSRRTLRAVLLIAVLYVAVGIVAEVTGANWLLQIVPGLAGGIAGALGALWLQRSLAAAPSARENAPVAR